MGRQVNIRTAAVKTLITYNAPLKLENQGYTQLGVALAPDYSPNNVPWLRFFYLPNQPEQITLGANGQDTITGVFQIDVMTPKNNGDIQGLSIADTLCETLFKSGTTHTHNGVTVKIRSAGVKTGDDPNWHRHIIDVTFYCYLAR